MNRQEKTQVVSDLKNQFSEHAASVLVGYKGLSVLQMQKLRRGVRQNGGAFKVAKARLMKIAAQESAHGQALVPFFKEQIGIVFTTQEEPILKFLFNFSKENEALNLVAGSIDSQLVDAQNLKILATLPSREVLLAQLCGVMNAPVAKLAYVLQQISNKKQ